MWTAHHQTSTGCSSQECSNFPACSIGSCSPSGNLIKPLFKKKGISLLLEGLWDSAVRGKACCGMVDGSTGWQRSCLNLWKFSFKAGVALNSAEVPWPLEIGLVCGVFCFPTLSAKSAELDLLVSAGRVPRLGMCFHNLAVLHPLEREG